MEPFKEYDQVCELTTMCICEEVLMKYEGMELSPAHTPTAEGELMLAV